MPSGSGWGFRPIGTLIFADLNRVGGCSSAAKAPRRLLLRSVLPIYPTSLVAFAIGSALRRKPGPSWQGSVSGTQASRLPVDARLGRWVVGLTLTAAFSSFRTLLPA